MRRANRDRSMSGGTRRAHVIIVVLATALVAGCTGTRSRQKSSGPTTSERITFSRPSLAGSAETPVVGVAPFSAKSGWNRTRLKDLELAKRLTRELKRKLFQIGATPESIPAGVLGKGKRRQRELTEGELRLIAQLNYAVTGSIESLEESPRKVTLAVTYEVYRGTPQEEQALTLTLKQTIQRESAHDDSAESLRSAAHKLVGIVATRIALRTCPEVRKRSQGAVRG